MQIGIIIICYNNEKDLNSEVFQSISNATKNIHLCFVNNGSNDDTLGKLQKLKEVFESNITIVDIKKNKDEESAIKVGMRYFISRMNLSHVGHISLKDFNTKLSFKALLKTIGNRDVFITYSSKNIDNKPKSRLLIKSVFSIIDYFKYSKLICK